MIRCLKLILGLLLLTSLSHAQMAGQARPPTPSSKKKKSQDFRDPIVSRALPSGPLDKESEAALKRSQRPGVLQAESPIPNQIYEIRIIGAQKAEPEAVLVLLKTRINSQLNPQLIAEDIRQIFKMGLFTDIQVEEEAGPQNSIILSYRLEEKATISEIHFTGNQDVSEDDLKEAIDLKPYQIADMTRIKENAEKIRRFYSDKGFLLVQVAYEIKPLETSKESPNFANVIFHIDEKSKVRVDSITIQGNHALSSDDIKARMNTKENHPLSFITQWGFYNEDMLEIDGLIIEQFYQEHGFLNVQVAKPRAVISSDKTRISVYISIIEGPSYRLGDLEITGDLLEHSEEFLREKISLQAENVFNKVALVQDISSIQEVYQDQGYAYVNIVPEPKIHDEDLTVDLNLKIEPGPLVYFGRFNIHGNSVTIDEVIRRELRVYEGELYSASLLRLSEQRLNQLGYFESVKITPKPGSDPDVMDIEIEVKEKRMGSVQAGGGYGTAGEGFLFQAQLSQNNLFGRGQAIMGMVQWSAYRRIFELQFIDPYLTYIANSPLSFSVRAYDTQMFFVDYYRASTGGELSLGYSVGHFLSPISTHWYQEASRTWAAYVPDFENLRFFLSFTGERVRLEDSLENVNYWGWHLNQPRYTTSLRPTLQLDQRNNRMFPTAGYFLEYRTEFASSYFGSILLADLENKIRRDSNETGLNAGLNFLKQDADPNNFIRYGATARVYYNFDDWFFLKNWVLKLNFDFGLINTFGVEIVSENFRMGGVQLGRPTGLRGYYYQSVGPVVNVGQPFSTQPIRQLVIGGNKQLLLNLELEFPLIKAINLSAVAFFDAGNVYSSSENLFYAGDSKLHDKFKNYWDPLGFFYGLGLYSAAGFGVRWLSPMGALRFEWGFPLVRRPPGTPGMPGGDSSSQFLFTIGQSF